MGKTSEYLKQYDAEAEIWVEQKAIRAKVLWFSLTHVEVAFDCKVQLGRGQTTALLVRDYLSIPMKVQDVFGPNVLLELKQPLHESVLKLVAQELVDRSSVARGLPKSAGPISAWRQQGTRAIRQGHSRAA